METFFETLENRARRQGTLLCIGLDPDPAKVETARKSIRSQGLYGAVSVERLAGPRLPGCADARLSNPR